MRYAARVFGVIPHFHPSKARMKNSQSCISRNEVFGGATARAAARLRHVPGILKKKELSKKPVFSIKEDEVKEKLLEKGIRIKDFKPSGIDIHPLSNKIYVIASAGKALVVLNKNGKTESAHPLDRTLFGQPEGICIMENGDLLISNEGKKENGNILLFKYSSPLE